MARKNKVNTVSINTIEANEVSNENTTETPATPVKASKAKGKVQAKDNGFKVVNTVTLPPDRFILVEKFRGRSALANDETVTELAESIRVTGQQQAIQVREAEGKPGYYEVIFGNTRKLAGDKIAGGYTTLDKREVQPNAEFKLRAEVVDCTDEEAFIHNVIENSQRTACSPIDNALNQEKLRTDYGMSDAAITRRYGYASQASVTHLKKLLLLKDEMREAVHNGTMTQAAGILFADKVNLDDEAEVTATWLAAVDFVGSNAEDATIGSAAVKKAIAKVKADKAGAAATVTGDTTETGTTTETTGEGSTTTSSSAPSDKLPQLTMKEFKNLVEEIAADAAAPAKVAEAMGLILDVIAQTTAPADFAKWFRSNLAS